MAHILDIPDTPYRTSVMDENMNAIDGCPIRGVHFRFLNMRDERNFIRNTTSLGGRPAYSVVQGRNAKGDVTFKDTVILAEKLGYPEAMVDAATCRIKRGPELVLATLPLKEWKRRRQFAAEADARARDQFIEDHKAAIDNLGSKHIKPVVQTKEEFDDRKAHAEREDRPFVSTASPPA